MVAILEVLAEYDGAADGGSHCKEYLLVDVMVVPVVTTLEVVSENNKQCERLMNMKSICAIN